ncbi:MAG: transporter [Candidatus Caenarcaniphilales bacterium]|nr:transporter [Candidatus Caenarcaniphilales bacterium]
MKTLACACGGHSLFGGVGLATPLITVPAHTLDKGQFAISTGINYQNFHEFGAADFRSINARRQHTHSLESQLQLFLSAAYGVTDDLDIIVTYPFNSTYGLMTTFQGITIDEGNSVGLGDMNVIVKYRFLDLEKSRFSAALLAGVKFPTGRTSETNEFGLTLAADDQPGTGSYDPLFGLAVSKIFDDFNVDANVLYLLSTEGTQDTISGDVLNFNLALSYAIKENACKIGECHSCKEKVFSYINALFPSRLLGQDLAWSLFTEMNGAWQEKVEFQGIKDDAHGGMVINWMNGLKVAINERFIWAAGITFPLIQDLNGNQPEAGVGLSSNFSVVF